MIVLEIHTEVDQIAVRWRTQTSTEQRTDLLYLDDLQRELDDVDPGTAGPLPRWSKSLATGSKS